MLFFYYYTKYDKKGYKLILNLLHYVHFGVHYLQLYLDIAKLSH